MEINRNSNQVGLDRSPDYLANIMEKWSATDFPFLNVAYSSPDEIQMLNSFAVYLYPNAEKKELIFISKVFRYLFFLDDMADQYTGSKKILFWEQMLNLFIHVTTRGKKAVLNRNGKILVEIFESLEATGIDEKGKECFKKCILNFVKAGIWEAKNLYHNHPPLISKYLKKLGHSSGAEVAIFSLAMIQTNGIQASTLFCKKLMGLRQCLIRIVCLCNDLDSLEKEEKEGDFHNLVLLLEIHHGMDRKEAIILVKSKLKTILNNYQISATAFLLETSIASQEKNAILAGFDNILKGCQQWTKDNKVRYGHHS
jgi:hypothetical protein